MGWYKNVSKTFDPAALGNLCHAADRAATVDYHAFGLGSISKIIMTVLAAVFPILINTMVGIANTDVRLITMARFRREGQPNFSRFHCRARCLISSREYASRSGALCLYRGRR
jgi:ABC-type nitrate/sulfonate/bicarbonate transport system permease component